MPRVLGLKKEVDEPTQFEQYDESPEQNAEDIEIDLTERPRFVTAVRAGRMGE